MWEPRDFIYRTGWFTRISQWTLVLSQFYCLDSGVLYVLGIFWDTCLRGCFLLLLWRIPNTWSQSLGLPATESSRTCLRWFSSSPYSRQRQMTHGKTRMKLSAQPDFIVSGAGPRLLEFDQDHFALVIFNHSTILGKKYQITINSVPNAQFKTCLHWGLQSSFGFFHKNEYCCLGMRWGK